MPHTTIPQPLLQLPKGTKILFAAFPADGHVNPLTGLADYLKKQGHDVRFYAAAAYQKKIRALNIPYYGFTKAMDLDINKADELFPDRRNHKSKIAKLNYDISEIFLKQADPYFQDLQAIRREFSFDLLVADLLFTALPLVRHVMKVPTICVGIIPLTLTSRDLPPAGIGATPEHSWLGRRKQAIMRWMVSHVLFAKSNKALEATYAPYGMEAKADNIFDFLPRNCDLLLQTGSPGFEYARTDLPAHVRFAGPLLPATTASQAKPWHDQRLLQYDKVVLATQGTVEKDSSKLLVPMLEALQNSDVLLVIATGDAREAERLRRQYNAPNVLIEAFIPFAEVMLYADVFVTNGGMGGVQMSLQHGLPLVVAGVHEGKNEICARVGYFQLGIDLKTEQPSAGQLANAVRTVMADPSYRNNCVRLQAEFSQYPPGPLCEHYAAELLGINTATEHHGPQKMETPQFML